MNQPGPLKVTAAHLGRTAYLYVRQSTVRQVFENTESTKRQYALRDRALALGWAAEQHPNHRLRSRAIRSLLGASGKGFASWLPKSDWDAPVSSWDSK